MFPLFSSFTYLGLPVPPSDIPLGAVSFLLPFFLCLSFEWMVRPPKFGVVHAVGGTDIKRESSDREKNSLFFHFFPSPCLLPAYMSVSPHFLVSLSMLLQRNEWFRFPPALYDACLETKTHQKIHWWNGTFYFSVFFPRFSSNSICPCLLSEFLSVPSLFPLYLYLCFFKRKERLHPLKLCAPNPSHRRYQVALEKKKKREVAFSFLI